MRIKIGLCIFLSLCLAGVLVDCRFIDSNNTDDLIKLQHKNRQELNQNLLENDDFQRSVVNKNLNNNQSRNNNCYKKKPSNSRKSDYL